MENLLKIKEQIEYKKSLFDKVLTTNNLSDLMKALQFKVDIPFKNTEFFYKDIIKKYFSFLDDKYMVSHASYNNSGVNSEIVIFNISKKHDWCVKLYPKRTNSNITIYGNGSTKAHFENKEMAELLRPIKDVSTEIAKSILDNYEVLQAIQSKSYLNNIFIKSLFKDYAKMKNFTRVNLVPQVYGNPIDLTEQLFKSSYIDKIFASLCQLLTNDYIKEGDVKIDINNNPIEIVKINGTICDFTFSSDLRENKHLSTPLKDLF